MIWRVILIWLFSVCLAGADFSHRLHTVVTSGSLQNLTYTYDQVGDIASVSDGAYGGASSASISSASYDDLHRLLSFTRPGTGQTVSCTYDSVGNMTLDSENGSGAYTYGASGGRLPHAVQSANGVYYAYDPAGNMVVRGNQQLFYDADNRLTNILGPTGSVTFGYDGGGARLWKQGSPTNTLQVWIGGDYEEKDGKILYHISADGRLVCTFDAANSVFEYYHPDHLHSAEVLSTTSGAFYQHYEYAAYGQGRYTNSGTAFPISARYTSQNLDEETGLYCYAARYYDPVLGRFIQPDSTIPNRFDPQAYDRYAYARDNPLEYVDPDGHAWRIFTSQYWNQFFFGTAPTPDPNYSMQAMMAAEGVGATPLTENGQTVTFRHVVGQTLSDIGKTSATVLSMADGGGEAEELYQVGKEAIQAEKATVEAANRASSAEEAAATRAGQKTYQTYTKENPISGEVYSGRTSGTGTAEENVSARDAGHHMNEEGFGPAQLDQSSRNPEAIRGREQQLIEKNGGAQSVGGTSGNRINGVSPVNPNAQQYEQAAQKEFPIPDSDY